MNKSIFVDVPWWMRFTLERARTARRTAARVSVELVTQRCQQRFDVSLGHRHNQVYIQGRARLTADGARQRAAHEIAQAAPLEGLGNLEGDLKWIGDHTSGVEDRRGVGVGLRHQPASQLDLSEPQQALVLGCVRMSETDAG